MVQTKWQNELEDEENRRGLKGNTAQALNSLNDCLGRMESQNDAKIIQYVYNEKFNPIHGCPQH